MNMKTLLGTKTKISTKTAVALVAGAVILAAAAAGAFSTKNGGRGSFFGTQGYGPARQPYLELTFFSNGYVKASPGDTSINFGEYRLKAIGADAYVGDVNLIMLAQDVPSSNPYGTGSDGAINMENNIHNCLLRDSNSGTVVSGPVFMPLSVPGSGNLNFDDDFTLAAGNSIYFDVECDLTTTPPSGMQDRFALDASLLSSVGGYDPATNINLPLVVQSSNGNPPQYYVVLR